MSRYLAIVLVIVASATLADASQPIRRASVYRGTWQSGSTGHEGPMRMRLTQQHDGTYRARFTGRFLAVIPFTYQTKMAGVGSAGKQTLVANKRLPIFGSFRTVANVTACEVNAQYCADRDQGRFTMRRVR